MKDQLNEIDMLMIQYGKLSWAVTLAKSDNDTETAGMIEHEIDIVRDKLKGFAQKSNKTLGKLVLDHVVSGHSI